MKRLATQLSTSAAALLLVAFACGDRPPDPEGEEGSPLEEPDPTNTAATNTAAMTTSDPAASASATDEATGAAVSNSASNEAAGAASTAADGAGGSGGI